LRDQQAGEGVAAVMQDRLAVAGEKPSSAISIAFTYGSSALNA
jgi:hypothetical protein